MGWLTEVDAAVADLRKAAQAASLYVPVPRGPGATGNFDRANPIRLADGAAALACHAAMKLLGGDAAASWSDAEALWRLGQLIARGATTGEYALAGGVLEGGADRHRRSRREPVDQPELLSTMQAGLAAKLGFPPATEVWMFHRLEVLDANGTPLVAPLAPGRGPMGRWPGSAPPRSWRQSTRSSTRSTSPCRRPIPSSGSRASSRPRRRWPRRPAAWPAACWAPRSRRCRTSGSRRWRWRWSGGSATAASCPRR